MLDLFNLVEQTRNCAWTNHLKILIYMHDTSAGFITEHADVIKGKPFPRYWPFVREFTGHRWIRPHKGQRRGALMFSLICAWINDWVNSREAGDLRRRYTHYDVIVMIDLLYNQISWMKKWMMSHFKIFKNAVYYALMQSNIFNCYVYFHNGFCQTSSLDGKICGETRAKLEWYALQQQKITEFWIRNK